MVGAPSDAQESFLAHWLVKERNGAGVGGAGAVFVNLGFFSYIKPFYNILMQSPVNLERVLRQR